MNDICPLCNSVASRRNDSMYTNNSYFICDFCSDYLNIEVWWWASSACCDIDDIDYIDYIDYIGFSYLDNHLYASYYPQTQKLKLNDGTALTVPQDKVITKLQTILLLS